MVVRRIFGLLSFLASNSNFRVGGSDSIFSRALNSFAHRQEVSHCLYRISDPRFRDNFLLESDQKMSIIIARNLSPNILANECSNVFLHGSFKFAEKILRFQNETILLPRNSHMIISITENVNETQASNLLYSPILKHAFKTVIISPDNQYTQDFLNPPTGVIVSKINRTASRFLFPELPRNWSGRTVRAAAFAYPPFVIRKNGSSLQNPVLSGIEVSMNL